MAKTSIVYSDKKIITSVLTKNKGVELYSFLKEFSHNFLPKRKANGDLILISNLILNYKTEYDKELDKILLSINSLVCSLNSKNTNIQNISISAAFTNNPDIISKIKDNKKEDIKSILKKSELINILDQDCLKINNSFVANTMIRNKTTFSYPTKKYFFFKITSKTSSL